MKWIMSWIVTPWKKVAFYGISNMHGFYQSLINVKEQAGCKRVNYLFKQMMNEFPGAAMRYEKPTVVLLFSYLPLDRWEKQGPGLF